MAQNDEPSLPPELDRLDRELELSRIRRELDDLPEAPSAPRPRGPSPARLRVERSLLAGASLLALVLGVQSLRHRCPEPAPAFIGPPDAGALEAEAGAPEPSKAKEPSESSDADECPPLPEKSEPVWVDVHLQLKALTERNDRSWDSPIVWSVEPPDRLADFFPAVSRDGKTVIDIYDAVPVEDDLRSEIRILFRSATTGKTLESFVLGSTREEQQVADEKLSPSELLRRREQAMREANRRLDATEWRHLPLARTPSRPCPGSPWEKLDQERSEREGWRWSRVARFDEEGIDLEYEPDRDEITIRAMQADGSIRAATVGKRLKGPGTDGNGTSYGIGGFGSRALGVFFVYGEDLNVPCLTSTIPSAERTSLLRLPRQLRGPAARTLPQ